MIGALIVTPLAAWGLSWLEGRLPRQAMLAILAGAVLLTQASQWIVLQNGSPLEAIELPSFAWLRMPGFDVSIGIQLDGWAPLLTTLTAVVLLLVLSVWPSHVSLRWLMLSWFGVTLVTLAGNLGQMFLGWTLSAWAASELARPHGDAGSAGGFRPVWLVQRVSDIALLVGIGLVWMHFGSSLEFSAWTSEAMGALRPELIESIALCVLVGAIGRCAQLPLTVWLETEAGFASQAGNSMAKLSDEMVGVWNVPDGHQVAERLKSDPRNHWHDANGDSTPAAVWAWWLCGVFLPMGIGLLVQFEPFFVVASHTRLLMVAVGAFTMLMCSANAACQNSWSQVLSQLAVGQCGLLFVALGLEQLLAVPLLCWQTAMLAVMLVASSCHRSSKVLLIAVACFATGLWGRHAILNLVCGTAWPAASAVGSSQPDAESLVFGATASRLWVIVAGAVCISEPLVSFSLLRAWYLDRRQTPSQESTAPDVTVGALWLGVAILLLSGLLVGSEGRLSGPPKLFQFGDLLPLSALGMVLAWWLYSRPSSLPEKFAAAMGPFARLSRNRFYWDDLYFLLFVHPVTSVCDGLAWFEEQVFGRAVRSLRNRGADFLGESTEPLALGSPVIGALTTVGSVVVLAWMLLWLRS
jgi:NADH:ubiquinone oxidoreductase subunit 5 (subunit L)/multisubunit Na+/H+ antiporter MnhA subunit